MYYTFSLFVCIQYNFLLPRVVATYIILPFIRIASLCIYSSIVLDILESIIHHTSITALITIVSAAVHQVLLTQHHQLPCLPEGHALQSPGGGE